MPDETRETFRDYVQAARDAIEPAAGVCPPDSEWINYRHNRLAPIRHDELQAHLIRCDACRQTLLDAAAFDAAASSEPDEVGSSDLDREWAALRERIMPTPKRGHRMTWLAAAASVLLAAGLTSAWIWRLQRMLDTERTAVASLEQQIRQLRRGERPHANLRLFDAFPSDAAIRSSAAGPIARVSLPAGTPFALILSSAGQPERPPYGLQLFDTSGTVVWEDANVSRDANGNFVVAFPAGFVRPGEYNLELSGGRGAHQQRIARYAISYRAVPITENPAQK